MSKAKEETVEERKTHKVVGKKVNKDDLMAFTYWVKVTENLVELSGSSRTFEVLRVVNLDDKNSPIEFRGLELIEGGLSADQFHEEQTVTKTKAAELLVTSHNRPLTVAFVKADGTDRKIRGRLISAEPLLGRSMVEDLDLEDNGKERNRVRLVDHRTITYLIVEGIKYTVK